MDPFPGHGGLQGQCPCAVGRLILLEYPQRGSWEIAATAGPERVCEKAVQANTQAVGAAAGGSSPWNVAGLLHLSHPTDSPIFSKQRPCA